MPEGGTPRAHPAVGPLALSEATSAVQQTLRELHARWFMPGVKLTFVARLPSDPHADIIVTADDPDEVIKALERTR